MVSANTLPKRKIINKIDSNRRKGFGGKTKEYNELSRLLASLINRENNWQHQNNEANSTSSENIIRDYDEKNKNMALLIEDKNRLQLSNGILPYVPCRIKHDYNSSEKISCLSNIVKKNSNKFHIVFLGDSKLRDIFTYFLFETKELNYNIEVEVIKHNTSSIDSWATLELQ